ncbi:MAG: TlpA family protein disulfide reductase [Candidatus Riflebacteria bacterium]|nr:TlpA family protein disulfide reductase [Candidatus Riflebacteria bacterium]
MNRNHFVLLVIAILTVPLLWLFVPKSEPGSIHSLEGVTLSTVTGEKFKISSLFAEKPTLLVFWSITCGTCIEEIPFIIKLHGNLKDRLTIIGVHQAGFPLQKIQKFLKKYPEPIPYLVAIDDEQKLTTTFDVAVMPRIILLNRRGEAVFSHLGYAPEMDAEIENEITSKL